MNSTIVAGAPSSAPGAAAAQYNYSIAYLRAALVALVVAHHAVLAYHPAATPPPASLLPHPRTWTAWPVFDSHHALWAGVFATFNDMFFMALMFLVSGLFVWSSLKRRGASSYALRRLLRLGVPFVAVATIVAPLSYYPTYLQIAGHGSFWDFLHDWLALGSWSAGPVWFTWVLLVFDVVAALLLAGFSGWGDAWGRLIGRVARQPVVFFATLAAITAVAYMPMMLRFGPFDWTFVGPFGFQTSRILFYAVYFFVGIGLGAAGLDRGFLARDGMLARRWAAWVATSLVVFAVDAAVLAKVYSRPLPTTWEAAVQSAPVMAAAVLVPVFCAATCFACLAVFIRVIHSRHAWFEHMDKNAYGIFLLHFVFVSWAGYVLAPVEVSALIKFPLVFISALAVSWVATALLRRIPGVARVV